MDHLCYLCFVFLMLSRLFIAALWSPAGKGLTSSLLLVMFLYFCYFPMWYPGSGVVLDCIVSCSLPSFLLCYVNIDFKGVSIIAIKRICSVIRIRLKYSILHYRQPCTRESANESVAFLDSSSIPLSHVFCHTELLLCVSF